jgi:hypothetical protein
MAITTITKEMVSVNAIQGTLIADNAITAVHIATNAVSGTLIADNAVTATHIAQNTITVTQLANDAVEADKIADGIITTNHLNKAMISSQTEVSAVAGDFVLIGDTSDSNNLKKAPVSSLIAGGLTGTPNIAVGTLSTTGALTLGDYIEKTSGNLTLDVADDIILDADGGDIIFKDGGSSIGRLKNNSGNFVIKSEGSDDDLKFLGNDGGSEITALTLDMSDAGTAKFGHDIKMVDNGVIRLGDGNDLSLFHDASNSHITNDYGVLYIDQRVDDGNFILRCDDQSGGLAEYIVLDGGAGDIKFTAISDIIHQSTSTNSTAGHHIFKSYNTEIMRIDGANNRVGIGTDSPDELLHVYAGSAGSVSANSNADLVIEDNDHAFLQFLTPANKVAGFYFGDADDNDVGSMFYDHNTNHVELNISGTQVMNIDSDGPKFSIGGNDLYVDLFSDSGSNQGSGSIRFFTDGASANQTVASIVMQQEAGGGSVRKGEMLFQVADNGAPATALKILNNKNVYGYGGLYSYYDATYHMALRALNGGQYIQYGSGDGLSFVSVDTFPNSGASTRMYLNTGGRFLVGSTSELSPNSRVFINANSNSTNPALNLKAATTTSSGSVLIFFAGDSDEVGSVSMSNLEQGSGVSYNTSSDYRLKENVTYSWDATTRLKQLKPARFNWIKDTTNTLQDGFLAHEVSSIVPEAVTGDKDAMQPIRYKEGDNIPSGKEVGDETGSYSTTEIKAQQIDHSKLVPLLVKTIQELEARITAGGL